MRKRKQTKTEREANAPGNLPSLVFMEWWNPTSVEEPSGASVGGHPDAERVWARKDPGRWARRTYGINAVKAWHVKSYREEYDRWVEAGKPDTEPFVSICVPLDGQNDFWKSVKATLAAIAKPPTRSEEAARRRLLQQQKVALLGDAKPVEGRVIEADDEPIPF